MLKLPFTTGLRRVFQEGFSARDIAQPLPSFDAAAACESVRPAMKGQGWEVAGVRSAGLVTGYVELRDLTSGSCGQRARTIDDSQIVPESLPLGELVALLKSQPRVFVLTLGQIGGSVTRFDLQQPPARMWLFGMITLIEMRFTRMIAEAYPDEAWQRFLSPGRLEKAQWFLKERRRSGQHFSLLDCLQFADKVRIIGVSEQLRRLTRFESRRQIEDMGKKLEQLRNNLAHAQDIITTGWETIVTLAENLDSLLDGPNRPPATA